MHVCGVQESWKITIIGTNLPKTVLALLVSCLAKHKPECNNSECNHYTVVVCMLASVICVIVIDQERVAVSLPEGRFVYMQVLNTNNTQETS